MYAKISYNADVGNDATLLLADITALLGGETVLANLTGDIDDASSVIDETFEAVAYTLYDDVSATIKVFQIPFHDDAAQFFYMELFVSGTDIDHRYWTTWDDTGHSGTGPSYYPGNGSEFASVLNFATSPYIIYLTVTDRHCLCRTQYNSGAIRYNRGYLQYDRGEAWDTPAAGKVPVVTTYNDTMASSILYAMPHKRSDGNVYTGNQSTMYMAMRYGTNKLDPFTSIIGNNSSSARGLNSSGDPVHNMYEFGFGYTSTGERFLSGKIHYMYLATYQNGGFGDIVSIGGNDYLIWEADTNYRLAIRKG
jgi:hypothetical protein